MQNVFDFLTIATKRFLTDSPMTPLREHFRRVHTRIADNRNEIIQRHTTEELQLGQIISRKRATEEIPFFLDDEAPTEQLSAVPTQRTTDPEIATFAHEEIHPVTIHERTTFPLRTQFPGSLERGIVEHMKHYRTPSCILLSENRLVSLKLRFPEKFANGCFVADNPALSPIPYGTDPDLDDLTIAYIS